MALESLKFIVEDYPLESLDRDRKSAISQVKNLDNGRKIGK